MPRRTVLIALALVAAAACAAVIAQTLITSSGGGNLRAGRAEGRLLEVGGPHPDGIGLPGVVVFQPVAGGRTRSVPTGPDGDFDLGLPVGSYIARAASPRRHFPSGACGTAAVTVRIARPARLTLRCEAH